MARPCPTGKDVQKSGKKIILYFITLKGFLGRILAAQMSGL